MIGLLLRDVRRGFTSGGASFTIAFFLLVATIFPFAIGPDASLLSRVGGGVIWAAALLAAILPVERLVLPDRDSGVFDQFAVRGIPLSTVMATRILAHWITFAPGIMLSAILAAGLLGIDRPTLLTIEASLLLGTPGLAALAVATSALVAGTRGAGAIAGLVMLPLALPLLIFGTGALSGTGGLKLLAAVSLLLVAGAPMIAAAAIRGAD